MQAVQRHAADGGPVLGICNGFQILCEAHLLPGALMRNAGLHFVSKPVDVIVERTDTAVHLRLRASATRLRLPVAHGEGRFVAADDTLRMLEAEGRVVLRYVADTEGSPLPAQSRTGRPRTSPASATPPATSSASCPIPSAPPTRCSASADGRGFFTSMAAWQAASLHREGDQPMSTEKPSRNEDEYFAQQNAELLRKQREQATKRPPREAERKSHYMKCPKDGYDLASSEYHGVQIETCPHCGGMWLDAGELDSDRARGPAGALTRVLSEALVGLPRLRARSADRQVTGSAVAGSTEAFAFPGERPVTPEVVREHNLNELEYERILEHAGPHAHAHRARRLLRALVGALLLQALQAGAQDRSRPPGPQVVQGPGENAGVLRLPDGWAVAFKIESHNHPSAVEPYQGAATGVGGILRDVFTMGARPVAVLNSLRFGPLDQPRNRYLFAGVVRGVGDYGNCVGVPTLGGEVGLRAGLHRQSAGQRDVRRAAPRGRPDPGRGRTASATCCSRSAPAPGATASTAPASPPRSCRRRARRAGPRSRWATPSPRSSCSRRASSSSPRTSSSPSRTWARRASPARSAEMAARGGVGVEIDTGLVPDPRRRG